jgi:hypothetical protein
MSDLISGRPMNRHEARALTHTIKRDLGHVYRNLLALHERRGHEALGYGSWAEYCRAEFDVGKSHAYRLLDAGRVVADIEAQSPMGDSPPLPNERVARELAKDPQPAEAWVDVVEVNGDTPTVLQTRAVVQERQLKDPATPKQVDYLAKLAARRGVELPDRQVSKAKASRLIDHLRDGHACECKTCGRRIGGAS